MKKFEFSNAWSFSKEGEQCKSIDLPHDAMQEQERSPDAPSGSGNAFYHGGIYEYVKAFIVPENWKEKAVILELEGVCPKAEVFLNGVKVGACNYGYTGYCFKLENLMYYAENKLVIKVDGSQLPDSRWYSGAGIYRPVWLWIGEKEYIEPYGIQVTTVSTKPAQISVEVKHTATTTDDLEIQSFILYQGQLIAKGKGEKVLLDIEDAHLWDTEHPELYECKVNLKRGEEYLDAQSTSFGIRRLSWSDKGFAVNDNPVLLKGGCIHHDHGILGSRCFKESEWRRIKRMKESGFNAVRSAHNPTSVSLLEACDALGMYVIDEGWDMWYKSKNDQDYAKRFELHFQEDIQNMVARDFNHPSVIMYSIGNEVSEPAEEKGVELGKELVRLFHELDPTRPVTAGINITLMYLDSMGVGMGGGTEAQENTAEENIVPEILPAKEMNSTAYNEMVSSMGGQMNMAAALDEADQVSSPILDALDIAGYNYASSRYDLEGEKHPERIIMGSETFPHDLALNWKQVEKYPYLMGDFMWTAWDYIGEVGLGTWTWEKDGIEFKKKYPWLLADTGAFDILGNDNAEAGMASVVWGKRTTPYIGVVPVNHPGEIPARAVWRGSNALPYWSYRNCDGNPAEVEVYGSGSEAELFINDRSLGKQTLKDFKAIFRTIYVPGILKAVVYDENGDALSESSLRSADGHTIISISPETQLVKEDEIIYVNINLTGKNGEIECNRDTCLEVCVTGGELLAYGSANPRTEESFLSGQYTTWYGRSLAIIKIKSNRVSIQASGKGVEPAILDMVFDVM